MKPEAVKPTKVAEGCSLCADGKPHQRLHMHARCHPHAPMRLAYRRTGVDRGLLHVQCYVPDCARPVGAFGIREVIRPPRGAEDLSPNDCDLCNDNDPRRFFTTAVNALHDFTAPFRLEAHMDEGGGRSLHVFCYVEECDRLFAVLAVSDEERRP
jgi:hypothetical protein